MRRIHGYLILCCLGTLLSCRKDQVNPHTPLPPLVANSHSLSLTEVKRWYDSTALQLPNSSIRDSAIQSIYNFDLNWQKAEAMTTAKGTSWLVAVKGHATLNGVAQGYRKLIFYRDTAQQIKANILEIVPDALYIQRSRKATGKTFTGKVWVYNERYQLTGGFLMSNGKLIGNINPSNTHMTNARPKQVRLQLAQVQTCDWVQDAYLNAEGVFTVYTYQICTDTFLDMGDGGGFGGSGGGSSVGGDYLGGGGGGGGTLDAAPPVANLPGENGPKVDPKKMMDCFGSISNAGAAMSVTVYVQEPWPGTSFSVGPNSVGHVAIGLTKANGTNSITQVVGFYPDASGFDKFHAPSRIVDNGGNMNYNVSITYQADINQFNKIIEYIATPTSTYDLSTFNCTNFVYDACLKGNILLPDPNSITGFNGATMTFEKSMTPGGLGNNIDASNSSNVNHTGGTTPFSKGQCN